MRRRHRNPAQRLRSTVDALPERTRRAMLRGIAANRIIVGAYTDPRSGGICPMLAAHRNGGRTDLASFAIAWDAFTDARRPRLATRREVRTLRSYLEISLLSDDQQGESLTKLAAEIRADRAATAARSQPPAPEIQITRSEPLERRRAAELRDRLRFTLMRPERRHEEFHDLVTLSEAELAEQPAVAAPEPAAP